MVSLDVVAIQLVSLLIDTVKTSAVVHQKLSSNAVTYWLVLETLQAKQSFSVYFRFPGIKKLLWVELRANLAGEMLTWDG